VIGVGPEARRRVGIMSGTLMPLCLAGMGLAQVIQDPVVFGGSLVGGAAAGDVPDASAGTQFYTVVADDGVATGENLFHSFERFHVPFGGGVHFDALATTENIIARVTGDEESTIAGRLGADANLFLLNPNGVFFRDGASLAVAGAFHASTADYLRYGDEAEEVFAVSLGEGASLFSTAPEAFGFLERGGEAQADLRIRDEMGGVAIFGGAAVHDFVGREIDVDSSRVENYGSGLRLAAVGAGASEVPVELGESESGSALGGVLEIRDSTVYSPAQVELRGGTIGVTGNYLDSPDRLFYAVESSGQARIEASGMITIDRASVTSFALVGDVESVEGGLGYGVRVRGEGITLHGAGIQAFGSGSSSDEFRGIWSQAGVVMDAGEGMLTMTSAPGYFVESGPRAGMWVPPSGSLAETSVLDDPYPNQPAGTLTVLGGGLTMEGSLGLTRLAAQSESGTTGNAGMVNINVGDGPVSMLHGAEISAGSQGFGEPGTIRVMAGSLVMDRGGEDTAFGVTRINVDSTLPPGLIYPDDPDSEHEVGGLVDVDITGHVELRNNATIQVTTGTSRDAGRLELNAGSLRIVGFDGVDSCATPRRESVTGIIGFTAVREDEQDGGDGADVDVTIAGRLELLSGGMIDSSSFGSGDSGNVTVSAESIMIDRSGEYWRDTREGMADWSENLFASAFFTGIGSDTTAFVGRRGVCDPEQVVEVDGGRAGDVTVSADRITVMGGGLISSSTTGSGPAGDVIVQGRDGGPLDLVVDGGGEPAGQFLPYDGTGILAIAVNRGMEQMRTTGMGGDVDVIAGGGSVTVSDGGLIGARSDSDGKAGDTSVFAREVVVRRGGEISVEGLYFEAGNVEVDAGRILLENGGVISADSGTTGGGNIVLNSAGLVWVSGDSAIRASALTGTANPGDGGNITIKKPLYVVLNDSTMEANADLGKGGRIEIDALVYLPSTDSVISATGGGGEGEILIDAEVATFGSEEKIEVDPLDNSDSLEPECTARLVKEEGGSFIRAGKGGTRRLPGGYLPSMRWAE
jgi:filamentous hemagglutinin family protein